MYITSGKRKNCNLNINETEIEQATSTKWLGITLNANLTIKDHVEQIKRKPTQEGTS